MTGRIYLDHAATTPLDERVLEAMLPYLRDHWGNPSSLYGEAQEARRGLEGARRSIAEVLGCKPLELVLTSGGSESDNLALRGAAYAARRQGHGEQIITTAIEHHAVLHEAERLQEEGFRVTYIGVDGEGFIDLQDLEDAVTDDTALVSIMYVNNEVGTIQSIEEAVRVVKAKNPRTVFHTDAVQATGMLDINVDRLGVDLLSIGAHKFYGPKGVGALYVRQRTPIQWQQLGGGQEKNRRAGTENVAGVVGMAEALELAYEELDARNAHARELRDRLLRGIPERIPHVHVTGPEDLSKRAANNFSACFEYIEGEAILIALDLAGVAASSGSACTSGSLEPSHVLTALGVPEDLARGSLRLTVGTDNAPEQIEHVLEILPGIVSRIRSLSPAWPERERV
ncbi:MAG: cysteine desulfurase [Chloroflexi bacterium]|nr:MAG: cysteine desulfurase [Chloroflexota bacterium]